MKAHNLTIDYIRAVLIILVILVHIVNFGELYPDVKSSILAFFMPAFLIITGYLVNVNKPLRSFALYIFRILLPYVIMVTGFMVLSLYLPVRDGVDELTPATVYRVLCITSIGPYWFLRVMMVCGVLYYAAFSALKGKSEITQCVAFATLLILVSEFTPFLGLKPAALFYGSAAARIPEGYIKDSEGKFLGGHPVPPPAYEQELPGLGRLVDLCVLLLLLPVHHMAFWFLPRRLCQSDGLSGTEYIADIHLPSDIHYDVKIHAPVVLL